MEFLLDPWSMLEAAITVVRKQPVAPSIFEFLGLSFDHREKSYATGRLIQATELDVFF